MREAARAAATPSRPLGAASIKKDPTLSEADLESLLIAATERPIGRPVRGQRRFCSGKKKRYTLETEIQVTERGRIVAEAFAEERPALGTPPDVPFRSVLEMERRIGRDGMVCNSGAQFR